MTFIQKIANFFHLGRLPDDIRAQMIQDGGIVYLAEGAIATVIYDNFRMPGYFCRYRRMTFIGFFALSDRRIVSRAGGYHKIDINTTYDDPKFKGITFKSNLNCLKIQFDPAEYIPEASGQIEVRLSLPDLSRVADILKQKGAHVIMDTTSS
jgi:hypothetical protein